MTDRETSTLTPKQALFVAEYLVDRNATQAAIRAGYSAKTAEQQGYRLLRNAQIQAATAKGREQRLARVQKTADDVVFLLSDMAFANRADVWGTRELIDSTTGEVIEERYMLHPLDWPPALQRCIQSFEVVVKNAFAGDGHVDTVSLFSG